MSIPRRFLDLFNINTELRERDEEPGGPAGWRTGTIVTAAAVVVDSAWITIAASVFLSINGSGHLFPEVFTWTAGYWGLLLIGCSLLGLVLARLEKRAGSALSVPQVATLGAALLLPALWFGWAAMYVVAPVSWWGFVVVRVLTALSFAAAIDMLLVSRVSGLVLQTTTRALAYQRFTLATVAVVLSGFAYALGARYGYAEPSSFSAVWLLTYLLSGLLLLSLAPNPLQAGASGAVVVDTRERVIYSVLSALVVAVIGVTLAVIVSPDALALVVRGLQLLWSLVVRILMVIALPAGLLVQILVWALKWLIHPGAPPDQLDMGQTAEDWMQNPAADSTGVPWLVVLLKILPAILLLVLAWWLLRRILRARRQFAGTAGELEVHESTGGLFDWLARKFGRREEAEEGPKVAPIQEESPEVRRVRELFREFLDSAAEVYRPIRPSETARRFERALTARFADVPTDLHGFVTAYESARYARVAGPADVARAEEATLAFAGWAQEREEQL